MLSGKNRDFHRQAFPSTGLAKFHEVSKGQGWGCLYEKHGPQHMTRQSVRMNSFPLEHGAKGGGF